MICGAAVLTVCEACGQYIRGPRLVARAGITRSSSLVPEGFYTLPDFCQSCAAPHPWAGRNARSYELENLLDKEDIGEAERLFAGEQLEALPQPELASDIWSTYRESGRASLHQKRDESVARRSLLNTLRRPPVMSPPGAGDASGCVSSGESASGSPNTGLVTSDAPRRLSFALRGPWALSRPLR